MRKLQKTDLKEGMVVRLAETTSAIRTGYIGMLVKVLALDEDYAYVESIPVNVHSVAVKFELMLDEWWFTEPSSTYLDKVTSEEAWDEIIEETVEND